MTENNRKHTFVIVRQEVKESDPSIASVEKEEQWYSKFQQVTALNVAGYSYNYDEETHEVPHFFCRCGYVGKGYLETREVEKEYISHPARIPGPIGELFANQNEGEKKTTIENQDFGVCPACGESVSMDHHAEHPPHQHVSRNQHDNATFNVLYSVKGYDNETEGKDTVVVSLCYTFYLAKLQEDGSFKMHAINRRERFTTNVKTGFTYIYSGKFIRNATYHIYDASVGNKHRRAALDEIFRQVTVNPEFKEEFDFYMTSVMRRRGMLYFDYKKILDTPYFNVDRLTSFFTAVRYPVLQHLPYIHFGFDNVRKDKKFRDFFSQATKRLEVLEYVSGWKAKSVHQTMLKSHRHFEWISQHGRFFETPEALILMTEHMVNANRYPDDGNRHGFKNQFFAIPETVDYFGEIRSIFSDEYTMVQKVIKDFTLHPETENGVVESFFNESVAHTMIQDTNNIIERIRRKLPDYELPYRGDLRLLHDELSREFARLGVEDAQIPYSKDEKAWEKTVGDLRFVLAERTHTLIEVGIDLEICVGSYASSALDKELTIVLTYLGDRLEHCLEIVDGTIIQAKRDHNDLPFPEHIENILAWAQSCQLHAETQDLNRNNAQTWQRRSRVKSLDQLMSLV